MNWLTRLKAEPSCSSHATNATTIQNVAFVAPTDEANFTTQLYPVAHLPQPALSPVQGKGKATNATNNPNVAFVAPPPAAKNKLVVQSVHNQWCWPHSIAMNSQEIDTLIVRLKEFTRKGVAFPEAELLADQLVLRDRDDDKRRLCVECHHLQGNVGRWRCVNAVKARMAVGVANVSIPADLTQQLQRCPGFSAEKPSSGVCL